MVQHTAIQTAVMAPSLLSVALELRLKIYRNLLISDDAIVLQGQEYFKPFEDFWSVSEQELDLCPAILGTCHQIYEEAAPSADKNGELGDWDSKICLRSLTKIKHVDLTLVQIPCYLTARCISSMLRYIKKIDCKLRTLHIFFALQGDNLTELSRQVFQAKLSEKTENLCPFDRRQGRFQILDALRLLEVQNTVKIGVFAWKEDEAFEIWQLVDAVLVHLGWKLGDFRLHTKEFAKHPGEWGDDTKLQDEQDTEDTEDAEDADNAEHIEDAEDAEDADGTEDTETSKDQQTDTRYLGDFELYPGKIGDEPHSQD